LLFVCFFVVVTSERGKRIHRFHCQEYVAQLYVYAFVFRLSV
jgi:hypothetical protein